MPPKTKTPLQKPSKAKTAAPEPLQKQYYGTSLLGKVAILGHDELPTDCREHPGVLENQGHPCARVPLSPAPPSACWPNTSSFAGRLQRVLWHSWISWPLRLSGS